MLPDNMSLIMPLKRKVLFRRFRLTNMNADLCFQVVNKMDPKTLSTVLTNTCEDCIVSNDTTLTYKYSAEYFTALYRAEFPVI